jgi:hypothetical protein
MIAEDYIALITSQHNDKPKFVEMTANDVLPYVSIENILLNIPYYYDIDTAIGTALDVIGEWVGANRNIPTPLTGVYFSFDDTVLDGWNSGTWKGEFDPDTGLTSLPDDSYRKFIKAKISANHWDGTIESAYRIWSEIFTDSYIIIQDNQNMTMSVGIAGNKLGAVDQSLLLGGYLALKPSGVRADYYAIIPESGTMFGWDIQNAALTGWDSGQWAYKIT